MFSNLSFVGCSLKGGFALLLLLLLFFWVAFVELFSTSNLLFDLITWGLLFGLVLTNLYNDIPVNQWLKVAIDSLWEWGGCVLSGLGIGNSVYGLMPESHMLMNGPLWFISCLLIVGYIIYFLLEKCEDWFIGILAPIGFIFVYGYFHFSKMEY